MKKTILSSVWILVLIIATGIMGASVTIMAMTATKADWIVYAFGILMLLFFYVGGGMLPRAARPDKGRSTIFLLVGWGVFLAAAGLLSHAEVIWAGVMDMITIFLVAPLIYIGAVWLVPFFGTTGNVPEELAILLGVALIMTALGLGIKSGRKKQQHREEEEAKLVEKEKSAFKRYGAGGAKLSVDKSISNIPDSDKVEEE